MGLPLLLPITSSILRLLEEHAFTLGRLRAAKLTAQEASWAPLRDALIAALLQELLLEQNVTISQSFIYSADDTLNDVTDAVLDIVLTETKGSYSAALYQRFAGGERPYQLRRPILGRQLLKVRVWEDDLAEPSLSLELREMRDSVKQAVEEADEAIKQRQEATDALSRFRQLGGRKQLIKDLNDRRRDLYQELKTLAEADPARRQDAEGFASRFFPSQKVESRVEGEALVAALDVQIVEAEANLAQLKEQRAAAQVAVEAKRKEEAEQEELRAALAAEEQAAAEAKKRAAELRARLKRR